MLVLAGPNGAGKSTAAPLLIDEMAGIDRYINADAIARGFSPFEPDLSAMTAGRVMLQHIEHLAKSRQSFALESTLSGTRLATRLSALRNIGYRIHLIYLWLPTAEMAVERVSERVRLGGHSIEERVIRRRYDRSLYNLMNAYRPISQHWRIYDNSAATLRLIAHGAENADPVIKDQHIWGQIEIQGKRKRPDEE